MRIALILLLFFCTTDLFSQVKFLSSTMKNPEDTTLYIGIRYDFKIETSIGSKVLNLHVNKGLLENVSDSTFSYILPDVRTTDITFTYDLSSKGKLRKDILYPVHYKPVNFPDAVFRLRVGTQTAGKISLAELKTVTALRLNDEELKIKPPYVFNRCELSCNPKKTNEAFTISLSGGDLKNNKEYQLLLSKLSKGDIIYFENIKISGPDTSITRAMGSAIYTIE